jgi:outer membrane biosynthesis protein TonB
MSSKNKNSKHGKTANHPKLHVLDHDPTPQELTGVIVQLRETIDDVRIRVLRQLNEALELCEAAIHPTVIKPVKPAVKPVVRPITHTVLPKKPANKPVAKKPVAKKQAERPTTDDQAGRPGNAAGTSAAPEKQVKRTSASVRLTPHELTLNIGAQPVRELAEQDAKDLLNNPKVFWYRPIQFPDPKRYQVQPRIESARVVERKAEKFSRSPWTVSVTIAAIGDDRRCESWLTGVLAKNRGEQE